MAKVYFDAGKELCGSTFVLDFEEFHCVKPKGHRSPCWDVDTRTRKLVYGPTFSEIPRKPESTEHAPSTNDGLLCCATFVLDFEKFLCVKPKGHRSPCGPESAEDDPSPGKRGRPSGLCFKSFRAPYTDKWITCEKPEGHLTPCGQYPTFSDTQQGQTSEYETLGLELGKLVAAKQAAYGDSFGKAGDVMRILYPEGVPLDKLDDALTVVRVLDKLFRIATDRDALGESPWRDIAGYAMLSVARAKRGS